MTPEIAARFKAAFDDYQALVLSQGVSLVGSQPTEGNIRGGLSTIEEKALGNIQKAGRCTVVDFLEPAHEPRKPGLSFMDSSSAAAEMVTLCAAAGSVVHFFPTGQGNVIGNPVIPVIKLSANPLTVATMSEHIDVDLRPMLRIEMNLDQAGDAALEMLARTINGRSRRRGPAAQRVRADEAVSKRLKVCHGAGRRARARRLRAPTTRPARHRDAGPIIAHDRAGGRSRAAQGRGPYGPATPLTWVDTWSNI